MNYRKRAFTLVELIVVITILAILGTIAFISLQGYSAQSRDSTRISDVSSMSIVLELFHLDAGKYPLPDDFETVTFSGEVLWYQGLYGSTVRKNVDNLDKVPTDPLTDKEYVYSVSGNKNNFEILNLLETDIVFNTNLLTETNAANSIRTPKVSGIFNGLFVKTVSHIVPTPSLITAEDTTGGMILDNTNIKSQITNGGTNIPKIGNIKISTGGLDIVLSVYTGSINKKSTDQEKINVMLAIQGAYTGSTLATSGVYKTILSKTSTGELISIAEITVLGQSTSKSTSNTSTQDNSIALELNNGGYRWDDISYGISCKDYLDDANYNAEGNGVYWIKPGATEFKAYCDMTTDGGGWTMVVAQYELDSVSNWNEGIQGDYDPILATTKGFTFNTAEIPEHNQIAFGKDLDPTFIDYANGVYTTLNIPPTIIKSPITNFTYHLSRDSGLYYIYHNPEETSGISAIWHDTLSFDKTGGRNFTWSFSPNNTDSTDRRIFALGGVSYEFSAETYALTVWVRKVAGTFLVGDNGGFKWSDGTFGTSCKDYIDDANYNSEGDGVYWIKPGVTEFKIYCDMTTDGGGWTLARKSKNNILVTTDINDDNVASLVDLTTDSASISDATYNTINPTQVWNICNAYQTIYTRNMATAWTSNHSTFNSCVGNYNFWTGMQNDFGATLDTSVSTTQTCGGGYSDTHNTWGILSGIFNGSIYYGCYDAVNNVNTTSVAPAIYDNRAGTGIGWAGNGYVLIR